MHVAKRSWSVAVLGLFALSAGLNGTAFASSPSVVARPSAIVADSPSAAETVPDIGRIIPNKICCNPHSPGCSPCP